MARSARAYGVRPPRAATSRRDFRIPQDPAVPAYLDERRCLGKQTEGSLEPGACVCLALAPQLCRFGTLRMVTCNVPSPSLS